MYMQQQVPATHGSQKGFKLGEYRYNNIALLVTVHVVHDIVCRYVIHTGPKGCSFDHSEKEVEETANSKT